MPVPDKALFAHLSMPDLHAREGGVMDRGEASTALRFVPLRTKGGCILTTCCCWR